MEISRCYDSHLHLLATGIFKRGLRLFDLKSPADLKSVSLSPDYFRQDWLVGFGWDQHRFENQQYPTCKQLDDVFSDFPVALTRADGHAVWLNSKAMEKVGYLDSNKKVPNGGIVIRDADGKPSGIFIESAKIEIDQMMPNYSTEQNMLFLREAILHMNKQGFTHVREMTSFIEQWNILRQFDLDKELSLYVEHFFVCENIVDYQRAKKQFQQARELTSQHMRACGIKLFYDGALGSEGALISDFYKHQNADKKTENKGLALWDLADVEKIMIDLWSDPTAELAIHTIGDEAVARIVDLADKVQNQLQRKGILHIEHGELIRPETVEKMKKLNVRVHMQPCHWLSDRRWLQEKIPSLSQYVFPWAALQAANISFDWGSDTPIEEASVFSTLKALHESSVNGVQGLSGELLSWHQHPNVNWGADCKTVFENEKIKKIIFDGQDITAKVLA